VGRANSAERIKSLGGEPAVAQSARAGSFHDKRLLYRMKS
jgi:hypothetical protein